MLFFKQNEEHTFYIRFEYRCYLKLLNRVRIFINNAYPFKLSTIRQMKLVTLPKITLIGLEVNAHRKDLHQQVPARWEKLFTRKAEFLNRTTGSYTEVTANVGGEIYRQIVGAEVEPGKSVPIGFSSIQIPSQLYIHFHHMGPLVQISHSFSKMHNYAGENGLATDEFKIDRGYLPGLPNSPHDLYLRVLK